MMVDVNTRRDWVSPLPSLSISQQCALLGLGRSTYYYEAASEAEENLAIMRLLDEEYTRHPFYGSRRMAKWLFTKGHAVNRKRVRRLMRLMGLEAIYPKPRLSVADKEHEKYPYLLGNIDIVRPNQVWSADITYIRTRGGFMYLMAIIDWYSRYVVAWETSNTLDTDFCITALEAALQTAQPDIFNTDQGCQFTSKLFTQRLKDRRIQISMDGRGRALDNIFIERLWRSVKYEEVYIKDYTDVPVAVSGLRSYLGFYNNERLHQSLDYRTPAQVHYGYEMHRQEGLKASA
jgi:putative transposase